MISPQTLRRPTNWQDFEELCKNLWGEIWDIADEIQMHGRTGQTQHGVDIFGIPAKDDEYYGIQCKGKSEYNDDTYTHPQFTIKEIKVEIEKAKKFTPCLKKFYLATTAQNDSKIQTFVREINLKHRNQGLFEVHLFCWERIQNLIDNNKQTHDWYVKNKKYRTNKSVELTFEDGTTEITCSPKFKKTYTNYIQQIIPASSPDYYDRVKVQRVTATSFTMEPSFATKINLSYVKFYILLRNTGAEPIEKYKIRLEFEGEIQDLANTNESGGLMPSIRFEPNTYLSYSSLSGVITPKETTLVNDDTLASEDIFIKPFPEKSKITIHWKLLSKDFKDEGKLIINTLPDIEAKYEQILVKDLLKVGNRNVEGEIEDFIIPKKEDE
jgi:hypothetical protein